MNREVGSAKHEDIVARPSLDFGMALRYSPATTSNRVFSQSVR
jgi:hypothetical protein